MDKEPLSGRLPDLFTRRAMWRRILYCVAAAFVFVSCAGFPRNEPTKERQEGSAEQPLWIKMTEEGAWSDWSNKEIFIDFRSSDGIPVTTYAARSTKETIEGDSPTIRGLRELYLAEVPTQIPGSYRRRYDSPIKTYTYDYKSSEVKFVYDSCAKYRWNRTALRMARLFVELEKEILENPNSHP